MDATELLKSRRLVPVVVINDEHTAVPLAKVLAAAGLDAIEVTLRTTAGLASVARIARDVPEMLVGAGSVRRADQVAEVAEAGGRFCVSPGHTAALCDAASAAGMPLVPGGATASEIMALMERGYFLQKFFPAELSGGTAMLRSLAGPLPEVRFFPTGGIKPANLGDYLALPNVQCCGGTWLVPADLLAKGDFDAIGKLARDAVALL